MASTIRFMNLLGDFQPSLELPTPLWYRQPEQQLIKAGKLWPGVELPDPPAHFEPLTESEVLMLHVPDSFKELWRKVRAPKGYIKNSREDNKTYKRQLRIAPKTKQFKEPVWLGLDPEHGRGKPASAMRGKKNLAGSEVLTGMIQFPDWSLAWYNGASAPHLGGYQLKREGKWSGVPFLNRSDSGLRQVKLDSNWTDYGSASWSWPTVRNVLS